MPPGDATITTRRVSFEVALFGFRAKGSTHPLPVPQGTGLQFSWILGLKGRHTFLMCRPFRACLSVALYTVAYQPRLGIVGLSGLISATSKSVSEGFFAPRLRAYAPGCDNCIAKRQATIATSRNAPGCDRNIAAPVWVTHEAPRPGRPTQQSLFDRVITERRWCVSPSGF